MDIPSTLATIKTAIDVGTIVMKSGKSLSEAELQLKIVALVTALSDARTSIGDLQEQLRARHEDIAELKRQLDLVAAMKFEDPFCWKQTEGEREGPYCQRCYEVDHKAIHLVREGKGVYFCHACDKRYFGPEHVGYVATDTLALRRVKTRGIV